MVFETISFSLWAPHDWSSLIIQIWILDNTSIKTSAFFYHVLFWKKKNKLEVEF